MRYLAGVPSMFTQGFAQTVGTPGDIEHALLPEHQQVLARSSDLLELTGRAGLTQRSDLIPAPGWEKTGAEGIAGLGSAAPLLPFGAPSVSTLLAGGAGGVAGEAAHQLFPESTLAPIAAGGLAGLSVGAAARRAGRQTVESIAKKFGTSETMEHAQIALEDAATNWRANVMDAKIDAARAPLDAIVPSTAPVSPTGIFSRANDLIARGGEKANVVRDFFSRTVKSGGYIGQAAADIAAGKSVTWEAARDFRTELGTALRGARPNERDAIEHLYGGITSDLGTTANAAGAGNEFMNFNAVSTAAHQFDSGPVERILSAKTPAESAFRLVTQLKRGGANLAEIRAEMPDAADELTAAYLRTSPHGWPRLSPEGQAVLVPDAADRATISAAHPPRGSSSEKRSLIAIASGHLGHAIGAVAGGMLPGASELSPLVTAGMGEITGMALPSTLRRLGSAPMNILQSPFPLAAGAVAGTNPLAPPLPLP